MTGFRAVAESFRQLRAVEKGLRGLRAAGEPGLVGFVVTSARE